MDGLSHGPEGPQPAACSRYWREVVKAAALLPTNGMDAGLAVGLSDSGDERRLKDAQHRQRATARPGFRARRQ